MWVTKLLISTVKKGFFAQKRPNFAQNWHFWSIWARPCRLYFGALLVGGLVVVARGLYLARHLFTLCYQIPQLCKCKCCEVSWNWLNCRVIMFCTPVRDYLTGGLPKQLLDKLVLNRCPKLDLPACKFAQRYQNLKIMAGCRSMLGGHFFTQIHLCSDP